MSFNGTKAAGEAADADITTIAEQLPGGGDTPAGRLEQLKEKGRAQNQSEARRHDALWGLLAETCWWFHETPDETKVTLFKDNGFEFEKVPEGKPPQFGSLIQIVWGFPEKLKPADEVTISQRNKTLQALHRHYTATPDEFRSKPIPKLKEYIRDQGGVAGFLSKEADANTGRRIKKRGRPAKPDGETALKVRAELARMAIENLTTGEHVIATASAHEPVRVGRDGLLVLLAKLDDAKLAILGSSNEQGLIESVAARTAVNSRHVLEPSLRVIADVLATQAFPVDALPSSLEERSKWIRTKLNEPSEVNTPTGEPMMTSKMLLIRGREKDILLSQNRTSVSVVTRCKLAKPLLPDDAISVSLKQRALVEQWMESGEIALLGVNTPESLEKAGTKETADFVLKIKNRITGKPHQLHFYKAAATSATRYQADFARDKFRSVWSVKLNPGWFAELRQGWLDPWFAGLGLHNQIIRPANATLRLSITREQVEIFYNLGGANPPSFKHRLPSSMSAFEAATSTRYLSKDLAPVLLDIADAAVDGDVTVMGDEHVLVFQYATASGEMQTAIPTLNPAKLKGTDAPKFDAALKARDTTWFYPLGKPTT